MEATNPLEISMELYHFGENIFEKHHLTSVDQIQPFLDTDKKFWLNVCGLHNDHLLKEISELFDIHIIALEDIKNTQQRPKLEEFDHFIFLVSKMIYTKKDITALEIEQVSIVFGKNFIISFQENSYDIFDQIRVRLENPHGRMRKMGTDYFTYTLLDAIIDQYYVILEMMDNTIEEIEDEIINDSHKIRLADVYLKRKALQEIKKIIWPTREMIAAWRKSESPFIKRKTNPFINDIYEHTVEIMENLEMQRENITTLVEIFMSNISLKQNEVMKTLTIIATIFIPLTFIAGVYGMNFEYMPELEWKYGYISVWSVFLISTLVMIRYFKKKRWF
ncbi:magnesium/cobalt transporter CorA [Aquiflexum sp.]|uniref:magnesium/cobalt transporter CorA n=1 Tax=Aquiflexum sp. TaxID=1872584 RepID=UPI0035930AF3